VAKNRVSRQSSRGKEEERNIFERITLYFSEQRAKITGISVALIVIVAIAYGSISYFHQRNVKDNEALWRIVSAISSTPDSGEERGKKELILVKEELSKLEKRAGDASVKRFSTYFIGVIDLKLGFNNDAVEAFRSLLEEGGVSPFTFPASMGLAYSYEGLSSYDKALTYFEKASESAPDVNGRGSAMYGMARCYELMGKRDKAREVYAEIIKKNPDYPDIGFIRVHLSSIS